MKKEINQAVIEYLLKATDFVTQEELASQFEVSKVTIARRIFDINAKFENSIILSERGRGYRIDYELYLRSAIGDEETDDKSRCLEVMRELLLIAPKRKRTDDVYGRFYVNDAIIAKDKKYITRVLKKWHLTYVRSNFHVSIEGTEKDIRSAMMAIVLNLKQATDMQMLEMYGTGMYHNQDFQFSIQQVEMAANMLGIAILYPYNVSLFAHIYVLLDRVRKYKYVKEEQEKVTHLKTEQRQSPEIYSVCRAIMSHISQYLGIQPKESEVGYLFDYLNSARLKRHALPSDVVSLSHLIAMRYVTLVSERLTTPISNVMLDNLEIHLQYMILRLKNKISLPNALLHDITVEYKTIFSAVDEVSEIVSKEFSLPKISEDESGFISLYFAKYLELTLPKLNVYVVCTTGFGTSELIAVKVKKAFPTITVSGMSSSANIINVLNDEKVAIDFIISTVPIESIGNMPVVLVSAMLTTRDIDSIRKVVGEMSDD